MPNIPIETRKQIEVYYSNLINEVEEEIDKKVEELIINYTNSIQKDVKVRTIYTIFNELKEKYGDNLILDCRTSDYKIKYYIREQKEVIELQNKISNLKNEKAILLMNLENNSKSSNIYKECLKDFITKFKESI